MIGGVFNRIGRSNKRPFSLQDPSITLPYVPNTVSIAVALIVSFVVPAVVTAIISLIFIPGPTATRATPKSLVWRRKLWELNTAWLGLALSVATAFMLTEGLKDLAGKPRPNMLARCRPDLSLDNIARYTVGGIGNTIFTTGATPIRVTSGICTETNPKILRDAFASWPSGHSSFSFAGLGYFTLFLCAKFAVGIPYLSAATPQQRRANTFALIDRARHNGTVGSTTTADQLIPDPSDELPPRNSAAAPPIYLLILCVFVPIGVAIFICVSRWFDFHHNGIDIFSGAIIGIITSYFSFRYYHMPVMRGSGWAWGARSRARAFFIGVGRDGYVGDEGWESGRHAANQNSDLEVGKNTYHGALHPGYPDNGDVDMPGTSNLHATR